LFQSLFWWITFLDVYLAGVESSGLLFQSLFWWITFLDSFNFYFLISRIFSFNPCFDGSPFWTVLRMRRLQLKSCFNPCFDGSPFWTWFLEYGFSANNVSILVLMDHLFGHRSASRKSRFYPVSILVLMDHLFGPCIQKSQQVLCRIVSILVLMDHLFGQPLNFRPILQNKKFQSLFWWITFLDFCRRFWYCNGTDVSILVLMDHLFGPLRWIASLQTRVSFNPCFDGSPFWTLVVLV